MSLHFFPFFHCRIMLDVEIKKWQPPPIEDPLTWTLDTVTVETQNPAQAPHAFALVTKTKDNFSYFFKIDSVPDGRHGTIFSYLWGWPYMFFLKAERTAIIHIFYMSLIFKVHKLSNLRLHNTELLYKDGF